MYLPNKDVNAKALLYISTSNCHRFFFLSMTFFSVQIFSLESKIPELNAQICDGSTSVDDPCDELCGGAGCDGMCGGLSCLNGALSKAEEALNSAKMADEVRFTT